MTSSRLRVSQYGVKMRNEHDMYVSSTSAYVYGQYSFFVHTPENGNELSDSNIGHSFRKIIMKTQKTNNLYCSNSNSNQTNLFQYYNLISCLLIPVSFSTKYCYSMQIFISLIRTDLY